MPWLQKTQRKATIREDYYLWKQVKNKFLLLKVYQAPETLTERMFYN